MIRRPCRSVASVRAFLFLKIIKRRINLDFYINIGGKNNVRIIKYL